MKKALTILIASCLSIACSREQKPSDHWRTYTFEEKEFYTDGNLKSLHQWNDTGPENPLADEIYTFFSEKGDTLSQRVNFYSLGVVIERSQKNTDYTFYKVWQPSLINEKLVINPEGDVQKEESIFMHIIDKNDSIGFKYLGMEVIDFTISLYPSEQEELVNPAYSFLVKTTEPYYIPKEQLYDNQLIDIEYRRKGTQGSQDSTYSILSFNTTFQLYEKHELQKLINAFSF